MDNRINGHRPIQIGRPGQPVVGRPPAPTPPDGGFGQILRQELEKGKELTFSAHAVHRLQNTRPLSDNELARLQAGVNRAAGKGARESLILVDDKAFIVSITNRTVITAVSGERIKENVFTQIDSAVIV
ncbi:MAG: TIGR02530 family flagellar biosynthesis protein [Bacillota bacterium]